MPQPTQCPQMTWTVTRSQSSRAYLGCSGIGDLLHGCAADKSAAHHKVISFMSIWIKISGEMFSVPY